MMHSIVLRLSSMKLACSWKWSLELLVTWKRFRLNLEWEVYVHRMKKKQSPAQQQSSNTPLVVSYASAEVLVQRRRQREQPAQRPSQLLPKLDAQALACPTNRTPGFTRSAGIPIWLRTCRQQS